MNTGAAQALSDNPDFADLVRALAAAPDRAPAVSVAPRVLAAIRWRRRLRRAAAAAAAAVALVAAGAPRLGDGAPQAAGPQPEACDLQPATLAVQPATLHRGEAALVAAAQRPDGSWAPSCGEEALAPAATGLAMLRLAATGDPAFEPALRRAAAWLRAHQNADGSFGAAAPNVAAHNVGIPALALLRLYETGAYPELFTPIDGAVAAVRARLAQGTAPSVTRGDAWLASALAVADMLEWTDRFGGDLRRALLRIDASGDVRFAAVAAAPSLEAKRAALLDLCI